MSGEFSNPPVEVLDPEIIGVFLDESKLALEDSDSQLAALGVGPGDQEGLNSLLHVFQSIGGNAAFFGLLKAKLLARRLEDVLALVRERKLDLTQQVMDGLSAGVERLKTIIARVREHEPEFPQDSERTLTLLIETLSTLCRPVADSGEKVLTAGLEQVDGVPRTMRVDERKIDEFRDYFGELIIVREMFANVGKTLRAETALTHVSAEYQRALEAFTSLSLDVQHSIMEVRKIPVREILQDVPRAIRERAAAIGKEVDVELVGADIAVDKSLVEGFEAPITHMVRNALDYGVEVPADREKAGKPRRGSISVTVSEGADDVLFTIVDDGAGIDHQVLRERAVRSGILSKSAAQRLGRHQALDLLFSPGVSSAKRETENPGTGVGMDGVKREVQKLGGRISVESEQGLGSTFRVSLSKTVTVQILDGFLVRVGNERFVLPLQNINESFRPARDEVHTVAERGECITRRGRVFPLLRFGRLLKLPISHDSPCEAIVVSIGLKDGSVAGLMVDDVLGTQQVVLREVDGIDTSGVPFSDGAVLGDGRVAMVLDVERLGALVA